MAQDRGPSWMAGQSESSNITHLPGLGPVPPPSQVGPGGGPPPRPAPVIYLLTARHSHWTAVTARMYIHVDDSVVLLAPPNQSNSTFLSSRCCSCLLPEFKMRISDYRAKSFCYFLLMIVFFLLVQISAEMEKALLQQVMSLTPEQINLLPPEQRNQVLQLQQILRQWIS